MHRVSVSSLKLGVSAAAMAFAATTGALAQNANPDNVEQVVVTGSRIVRNGNDSPTPVAVITADEMQQTAPLSVPDALVRLPNLAGSQSLNSTTGGFNGGGTTFPGDFLNLNGLGAGRTLILVNGHRVNPTQLDNTTDTNTLPQQFVKRVDVVTGGASAVYGSDAIAGVVNFITDTHYKGLKGSMQGGISMYGDSREIRGNIAGGLDLFDGRGHFEASADYTNRDEVKNIFSRPFGQLFPQRVGGGTAANPYYGILQAETGNVTWGGVITNGGSVRSGVGQTATANTGAIYAATPLNNMKFNPDGSLSPFVPGTATATTNLNIGGDGARQGNEDLEPSNMLHQEYARFDYDLTSRLHWYVDSSFGQVRGHEINQDNSDTTTSQPLGIYSGNAYLQAGYQAQLTAAGFTLQTQPAFLLNRYNQDLAGAENFTFHVNNFNVSTGLSGQAWGDWTWDVYYTHGQARNDVESFDNVNLRKFYAAADAVVAPAIGSTPNQYGLTNTVNAVPGSIVCRATLMAPGTFPGCVPIDLFGDQAPSAAARAYVFETTKYWVDSALDDFAGNLTGTLWSGWAGPIKGAAGIEYRVQSLAEYTSVANNAFDPTGLRPALIPDAVKAPGGYPNGQTAYSKDVNSANHGANSVYEGNVEVDAPVLKDLPMAELVDVDLAYRYTDYKTSGSANTWKLGLSWQPLDDVRIRASRSRDIHAPTLYQLFQGVSSRIVGFTDTVFSHTSGFTAAISQGNPNLKSEVARNTTAGVVYTPSWLPGFSISADFFRTYIANAITSIGTGTAAVQQACIASAPAYDSPYCVYWLRTSNTSYPYATESLSVNSQTTYTEGYLFEMNYRLDLSDVSPSIPGVLTQRLFFERIPINKSAAISISPVLQAGGIKDRATYTVNYDLDQFSVNAVVRYNGPYRNTWDPTVIYLAPYNNIPAYYQLDMNVNYKFTIDDTAMTAFLNVNNVTDATGVVTYPGSSLPGYGYPSQTGADIIGRYYRVGLRFSM
jgi:outer membrane receptor protein involved in Fe transport